MIKLKSLLFEEETNYPSDAPDHFGGGENIDIFGYQTKHFDICRSAVTLYEKLKENEKFWKLLIFWIFDEKSKKMKSFNIGAAFLSVSIVSSLLSKKSYLLCLQLQEKRERERERIRAREEGPRAQPSPQQPHYRHS